ncbi:MAG: methylated-DNA--[protein]-cysteine S-methyltransferase [Verrucomicrobia bacterium]|nr:methylated-DNA--[protein]-cysteine S-methyltransferase [Verrucomicrobiota bacterium]
MPSIFGPMFCARHQEYVVALEFLEQEALNTVPTRPAKHWPQAIWKHQPELKENWISELFKCERGTAVEPSMATIQVLVEGTEFQHRVWHALTTVRPGRPIAYSALAEQVQCRSARAVGSAIAANPIAWLIPCHRIIRRDGATGEFRWGAERKQAMLNAESLSARR